jgi:diguanylate cyclase (GGDEF)-like protein
MLKPLWSWMDRAYHAQVGQAPEGERARLRVVNLLALLGLVLSLLYVALYGLVLRSPLSVVLNVVFTLGYAGYFAILRASTPEAARVWLAVVFVLQIALFSVLVYPKESGFHLYVISGVPFAFLVFGHQERWLRGATVVAMLAVFLVAELLETPKILDHLPAAVFRANYLIVIPLITLLLAVVLHSFLQELHHSDVALRLLTVTDPMTGVANRRGFLERAEVMQAQASRTGYPLCVLMLDIDHFKAVNDLYGHQVGDRLLVAVANALRERVRKEDVLGRIGGEEFAVVLANTTLSQGLQVAENLRLHVSTVQVPSDEHTSIGCTVSLGVTMLSGTDEPFGRALSRADQALYLAKAEGRNRVCANTTDVATPAQIHTDPLERRQA